MRARFLTLFALLGCSLQAGAQVASPQALEQSFAVSESAPTLTAFSTAAEGTPVAPDSELQLVVALFRHGVRAPLKDLNDPKNFRYTSNQWPKIDDWHVGPAGRWGDLTEHGYFAVQELGKAYAQRYKQRLPPGTKAFLWGDVDRRTISTAKALADGLTGGGIPATTDSRSAKLDPIFHTFKAGCPTLSAGTLNEIAGRITANANAYIQDKYAAQFKELYGVLACNVDCGKTGNCTKLSCVTDNSASYCLDENKCCDNSGPIKWNGQFPVANTAAETFLLEYENGMKPGWGVNGLSEDQIVDMMPLHDFYFTQTQRDPYLAAVDASNLLQQISWKLNGKQHPCRVLPDGPRFTALVGHDTNIASLARLLGVHWSFKDAPAGTTRLPDDDPLPAGALVFELYKPKFGERFVNMVYMAQGIREVRNCKRNGPCPAFRVTLGNMKLSEFTKLADSVAKSEFVCCADKNSCPPKRPE